MGDSRKGLVAEKDAGDDNFVAFGDRGKGLARFEHRNTVGFFGVHRLYSSCWLDEERARDARGNLGDGLELRVFVQCRLLVGLLGFHESLLWKEISL